MQKFENFTEMELSQNMLNALRDKGFANPTPIQQQIIPRLLTTPEDLIAQAQTGTGKTAAFGIPLIEHLDETSRAIQALILVPTRELALQVSEELNSLLGKKRLSITPVYGGQSLDLQIKKLKRGVDIVVGTPGRVLDHLGRGTMDLSNLSFVVLDEADEMLNMGFLEDVEKILEHTNPFRTTLLFSATMPREIISIARNHMNDFEIVATQKKVQTVDSTEQIYYEVAPREKLKALTRIIDMEPEFYGLVFCKTRADVDELSRQLIELGYQADGLHGDISQSQREKILSRLKRKQIQILVATDVAARGIDVHNLTHVINYSIPQDSASYVHRIGRTGRAGKAGTAITLITRGERRRLLYIQNKIKTQIRKERVPKPHEVLKAKRHRLKLEIEQIASNEISEDLLNLAAELVMDNDPVRLVAAMLKHSYQDTLENSRQEEMHGERNGKNGKTRLFIAKGKKNGFTRRRLVEFIKSNTGIHDRHIDDVEVMDSFSFVSVPHGEVEKVVNSFPKGKSGKRRPLVEVAR
ncbi:MAG: DEAD/DEAH box helicase [Calditrichaeota bacterium]|nr:MAG: DEAD/DEAH box helicase [Calditrichota bacterium]